MLEQTPMVGARITPKRLGESKRGQQYQSIAVGAHERNGVQVADQAVLSDGQVAPAVRAEPRRTRTALLDQHGRRTSSASVLSAFRHEYELSRRRRALEQLVRSAHFGEWQALGHDRVDLATAKQFE